MLFQELIDAVPDYKVFLTVDELDESTKKLAKDYPDAVTLINLGASTNGSPIYCLKIGDGPVNALAFACPHPNEPIGATTLHYFSSLLAQNKELLDTLGCTWYIIKCADPDGTRLNEGWFKGPFTLLNYARDYYRPIMNRQVEWTFPIDYKNLHFHSPIPETQALMRLIDEIKPKCMFSLHNAGFGGAFWYVSKNKPEVYSKLPEIAGKYGVPLLLGEPEMPCCEQYIPAVYRMFDIQDMYDYYEQYVCSQPEKLINSGTSSDGYANTIGNTFTVVSELPYFFDPRVNDTSLTEIIRRDAIVQGCEIFETTCAVLKDGLNQVGGYIPDDNPFKLMMQDFVAAVEIDYAAKKSWALTNEEVNVPAKTCDVFDNLYGSRFCSLIYLGGFVRMLRDELKKPCSDEKKAALEAALTAGNAMLEANGQALENDVDYKVIPIRNLVSIQLESIFTTVTNLMDSE